MIEKNFVRGFKAMKKRTVAELMREVMLIAEAEYDGHFSIFGFTTNYKGCFGTISLHSHDDGYAEVMYLPAFNTIEDLLQWLIDEKFSVYDIPQDLPPCEKMNLSKPWKP
jgi:hypothetical protein